MKSSKQTLAENSFILIFSTAIVKIIGAFFKIPLANDTFLGEIGFGYYSIAHDLYMPFYTLAISGLPVALSHLIAEKISKKRETEAINCFKSCKRLFIICGIIFSVLLAILTIPISLIANGGLNAAYSILTVTPSVFLCFLLSVYRGYFEAFNNMKPTAVSKIIEAVCKLILGLVLSFAVLKTTSNVALAASAAMCGVTIGTAFSALYLYYNFKQSIKASKFRGNLYKTEKVNASVLKIAIPFALSSLAASIVALLDVFTVKLPIDLLGKDYINEVLSILQNDEIVGDASAYLYGVRSKAFTIYNLIPTFTAALGVGALPVITTAWAKKDNKALQNNVNYTLRLVCTVTFPAAIGIFSLSNRIMSLLYSKVSNLGSDLLRFYAIAGLFAGIAIPLTTVLQAIGKHRTAIISIVIGIILKIVTGLSLTLLPLFNIYAAPTSTIVCYMFIAIEILIAIGKSVSFKGYLSAILKPLFAALICGICAIAISQISYSFTFTILSILVAVLVYFGIILITKVFTLEEIKAFPIINRLFKSK